MCRTDDPYEDYLRHEAEQERAAAKLPQCCECGEPIQDEFAYHINDEWICETCMKENYRKAVDDYVE